MKAANRSRLLSAVLLVSIVMCVPTNAQTTPPPRPNNQAPAATTPAAKIDAQKKDDDALLLDPFTVTGDRDKAWNSRQTFSGARVAEDLLDIATNISIINKEFMEDIGANNLHDIATFTMSGVNSRVSYGDDFTIRGFREPTTLDGLDARKFGKQVLYDIETLELIKGPGGLVFGNEQTIGGTVNYTTKRPTAIPMGDLQLSYGSYNTVVAAITQRGPVTADGNVRFRVTAGFQESDGFRETEYEDNRLISGSIDWKIRDNLLLRVDGGYTNLDRKDFNRDLVDPATLSLARFLPDDFSTTAPWNEVVNEHFRGRAELSYRPTKDLWLRVQTNWIDNHYWYHIAQPTPGLRIAQAPNYRTIGQRYLSFDLKQTNVQTQADVVWTKAFRGAKNRLSAGWDHRYQDGPWQSLGAAPLADVIIAEPISARPSRPSPTSLTWLIGPNAGTVTERDTFYARDAVTLWENRIIVSAGLRYISKGDNRRGSGDAYVPEYGVVFKPIKNLSIYGNFKEAYRPFAGGIDIFGRPTVDIIGENKEVGIKLNLFDGRLFGTIAYFDIFNDPVNTQVQGIHPTTGILVFGNAQLGKETNKGFEADVGFTASVPFGTLLTFVTAYDCDPRNAQGTRPFRAVAKKYTAFSKYEFKETALKGWGVGFGYGYFGDSPGTGIPIQPSYEMVSALVTYRAKNWGLALNLDNLLNEKNAIVGSEANFSVNTARPFNWKVTYTRRW